MKRIDCFIPAISLQQVADTLSNLAPLSLVKDVYLLVTEGQEKEIMEKAGHKAIVIDSLKSSATLRKIAEVSSADYTLLYTKYTQLEPNYFALNALCSWQTTQKQACCTLTIFKLLKVFAEECL